jgi:molecular chaperone GrpE
MIKRHNDNGERSTEQDIFELDPEAEAPNDAINQAGASSGNYQRGETMDRDSGDIRREIDELRTQLDAKDKEIAELKDKSLRTLADSENARRRIRQQSDESVRLQRENMLRDLLPIVDNLERAVDAARGGGNGQPIVQGVEMVLGSLMDFLKAQGVTPSSAVGQQFDPSRHEAIDHVHSDTHPANTVVQEFNKGYIAGERVLRPARVVVAKGKEGKADRKNGENRDNH